MKEFFKANKAVICFWVAVLAIQFVLIVSWQRDWFAPSPVPPKPPIPAPPGPNPPVPSPVTSLVMNATEAKLTKQAIELVSNDIVNGSITTTELALKALYSLLPSGVREAVIKELGTPEFEFMVDALSILEGKIEVRDE